MSFEELCFAIVGVVSAFFILAAFIGMLRESKQMDKECIVLRRRLDGKGEEKWAGETETEGLTEGTEAVKMENGKKD